MYVLGYSGFTRDSRISLGNRNPFAKTRQDFDTIFDFREGEVPFQLFPLGFFGHDSAAALLRDGKIVACAAEERFNRAKFSLNLGGNTLLPKNAIDYCLKAAKITIDDIDLVAHYCDFNPTVITQRVALLKPFISGSEYCLLKVSYQEIFNQMMDRRVIIDQFERMTGKRPGQFLQVRHHHAHAASAYYPSGFSRALILTVDGTGETESSLLAIGEGNRIREVNCTYLPASLGALYLIMTVFLGFKSLGDEYKVMGLAGYGKPEKFRSFFRSLICLNGDGAYTMPDMAHPDFKRKITENLGAARHASQPIESKHADIAAALQESLQTTVMHTLRASRKKYHIKRLCMAGGVALNSVMNGVISDSGLFDDIYIQPASSDEGCSIGAAYHGYVSTHPERTRQLPKLRSVYLGPSYKNSNILQSLKNYRNKLSWKYSGEIPEQVATEIASGKVVGWFQGRMEFGPRALGNRSILADPRPVNMKDRINAKIKHREAFRPFAPAVPEEDAAKYFKMNGLKKSPFMLFVVPVKKSKRKSIPAVTHVDGTARVQTVSRSVNPKFWQLLNAFKKQTGIPVLLNTSFNVMNEPIVCTPTDAIRCFLNTDIDLLVMGNYVVKKNHQITGD